MVDNFVACALDIGVVGVAVELDVGVGGAVVAGELLGNSELTFDVTLILLLVDTAVEDLVLHSKIGF